MILRPRHVSAGSGLGVTFVEDGTCTCKNAGGAQDKESVVISPGRKRFRRQRRQYRPPRSFQTKVALWTCCGGCIFLVSSSLLFAWCRLVAMRRVVVLPTAERGRRGGDGGGGGTNGRTTATDPGSFTVLINTFERPRQLEEAVQHYAECDGVDSVRVVWSERSPPPRSQSSPQLFDHRSPVSFHAYPTTSINNRFIPPPDLATDAVFVVDDDITVPCGHLLSAFRTWQRHQDALVGFFPRSYMHRAGQREGQGEVWEYLYFWRVLWHMEYSLVLTKAAFVHGKYLELYSGVASDRGTVGENDTSAGSRRGAGRGFVSSGMDVASIVEAMVKARAYVDSHRNCEDIAMQMLATTVSGRPPVVAFAPIVDRGLFGGISTGEGSGRWWQAPHAMKRSRCLIDLHQIFCPPWPVQYYYDDERAGSSSSPSGGEERPVCEALLRTNLFAVSPREHPGVSSGIGRLRTDEGDGGDSDLSRLSRWALAVRAPTLAEFFSADMLLVPGKVWNWLAKEDILGREGA